ncbi:MAG: DbpA RNA binding domain-containing protein, partial [Bacteroidota bacterium]
IKFIIHYHLPHRSQEFTHRNGRTARMHQDGTAYVLHWKKETLPDFIQEVNVERCQVRDLPQTEFSLNSKWSTLMLSGGRRDKISKGDIAGFFFKQGNLQKEELGRIELKQDCAFAAVPTPKVKQLIKKLDGQRVKKRKVKVVEV